MLLQWSSGEQAVDDAVAADSHREGHYKPNLCRYALGETPVCRRKRLRKNVTS